VLDQDQNGLRSLCTEEYSLIHALLGHVRDGEQLLRQLEHAQVRDMNDGGMGSLEFAGGRRPLGRLLVEAEYLDRDGVLVSIALNADQSGRLYELDMWKVDFAPLQEFPTSERVTIKPGY
jgi:hypothetical protein